MTTLCTRKEADARVELARKWETLARLLSKIPTNSDAVSAAKLVGEISYLHGVIGGEVVRSTYMEARRIAARVACDSCGNGAAFDANGSPVECIRCA